MASCHYVIECAFELGSGMQLLKGRSFELTQQDTMDVGLYIIDGFDYSEYAGP